jgi:hypothetical protein
MSDRQQCRRLCPRELDALATLDRGDEDGYWPNPPMDRCHRCGVQGTYAMVRPDAEAPRQWEDRLPEYCKGCFRLLASFPDFRWWLLTEQGDWLMNDCADLKDWLAVRHDGDTSYANEVQEIAAAPGCPAGRNVLQDIANKADDTHHHTQHTRTHTHTHTHTRTHIGCPPQLERGDRECGLWRALAAEVA